MHASKQSMSSAYVLSSFTRCHTSGILQSLFAYLNISESSILFQMNSHTTTFVFSDMLAIISLKCQLYQTRAGNFKLAYCSRALESSDWFLLVIHLYSHQSVTLSLMVTYVTIWEYAGFSLPLILRIE